MGYWMLRDWARAMPAGYFVVTSNVDGHFEAAGFPSDRILEQHGSIHRYQCTLPCGDALWQDDPPDLDIDLETLQARGTLPRCPECGALARPNVMMFGDVRWVARATKVQQQRYAKWLASVRGKRVVILECGAGKAIATIRSLSERLAAERSRVTLVRINPDATDADEPVDADPDGGARGADADRGEVAGGVQEAARAGEPVPRPVRTAKESAGRPSTAAVVAPCTGRRGLAGRLRGAGQPSAGRRRRRSHPKSRRSRERSICASVN